MAKRNKQTKCVIDCQALQEAFLDLCVGAAHNVDHQMRTLAQQKFHVAIFSIDPTAWPSGYDGTKVDWKSVHKHFELKRKKKNAISKQSKTEASE